MIKCEQLSNRLKKILTILLIVNLSYDVIFTIHHNEKINESVINAADNISLTSNMLGVQWNPGVGVYHSNVKYISIERSAENSEFISYTTLGNGTYYQGDELAKQIEESEGGRLIANSSLPDFDKMNETSREILKSNLECNERWWADGLQTIEGIATARRISCRLEADGTFNLLTHNLAKEDNKTVCEGTKTIELNGRVNAEELVFPQIQQTTRTPSTQAVTFQWSGLAHYNTTPNKITADVKIYTDPECKVKLTQSTYDKLLPPSTSYSKNDYNTWLRAVKVNGREYPITGDSNCRYAGIGAVYGQTKGNLEASQKAGNAMNPAVEVMYYQNDSNDYSITPIFYYKYNESGNGLHNPSRGAMTWGSGNGKWNNGYTTVVRTCSGQRHEAGNATIRPTITMNQASILFASSASMGPSGATDKLSNASGRIINALDSTNTEGYKLTAKDPAMGVTVITNTSGTDQVQKVTGNRFVLTPGATKLNLTVTSKGTGKSVPNKIAAYTTGKDGSALFGEVGEVTNNSSTVEIDLTNIMDTTKPGVKTISLYAEQQNEAYTTNYMSEKYDITLSVPVDQTLGLKTDSVLEGTYGDELNLTAIVNGDEPDRKWDAANPMTASIASGYEDYAAVKSSTWDEETGTTAIVLEPKKAGTVKLKLSKESDPDNGIVVSNNDVETAEIKINPRKVTLKPKEQKLTVNALYEELVILDSNTDDDTKVGLLEADKLPAEIKVKTKNKLTSVEEEIPKKELSSGKQRLTTTGTWSQEIDMDAYDASSSPLKDKYTFTTDVNDYVVSDALVPSDEYIDISPKCTYEDEDKKCWNSGTVTIKPSKKAIDEGYDQIKNTTESKDMIENDESGFASDFTITAPRSQIADIKYNLRNSKTDALSDQGVVEKAIRIDDTAPSKIDVKSEKSSLYKIAEAVTSAVSEALEGDVSGIRFDKLPMQLTISAEDKESGIREIKAYKLDDDGNVINELSITEDKASQVENPAITGPVNTIDGTTTYSKKVYKGVIDSEFNGRVQIVATNNAGSTSEKKTNKMVHEPEAEAGMVLEAGATAVDNGDGTYKITKDELDKGTDIKWPMKIQASKSGIKKISYYITDASDLTELSGKKDAPFDVTTSGYGIKKLSGDLAWDKAEDNQLDITAHDEPVVALKEALDKVKGKGDAILHVHAKLESNAGNIKEEVFSIQALYQEIEWSPDVMKQDEDPATDDVLDVTYGTKVNLSAEMVDASNRWSDSGIFTYSLSEEDAKYAKLMTTTQEAFTTAKNPLGTANGKAETILVPLSGDDREITVKVQKAGDSEYLDSNELSLKVRLKSKPIDITADSGYDVRTGEIHPTLTWKITDKDAEDGGLVSDKDAGIDDVTAYETLDFKLAATECVGKDSCGTISDLKSYVQGETRINETGEWKLKFQYDQNVKTGDLLEAAFNQKYAINFIDYDAGDKGADKTLKVTQDSFTDAWYTITPELPKALQDDLHAWNTETVTVQPTEKAKKESGSDPDKVTRRYSKIINDVLLGSAVTDPPQDWPWADTFEHTKTAGTDAKTYKLRFRDPTTGAFTAEADAKRSIRVDETAPVKPFISVNDTTVPGTIPEEGLVQGKRFSKDGLQITAGIEDAESGIRSFQAYIVVKQKKADGTYEDVVEAIPDTKITTTDEKSDVDGVNAGEKAVKKRTLTFTIDEEFKGSIRIVGENNAGEKTTLETGELINEPDPDSLSLKADEKETIPEKITRETYDEDFTYPFLADVPVSGIKSISYTMQVADDSEGAEGKDPLLKKEADITKTLDVTEVKDEAVMKGTAEAAPTFTLDHTADRYDTYFKIKEYIDQMITDKVELGKITIKVDIESNAGNTVTKEFVLPVDLLVNDAATYIITPKRVELKRSRDEPIALAKAELKLVDLTERPGGKPGGLDITQYFNIYTSPQLELHSVAGNKKTYTVTVYDDAGNELTSERNLLTALHYEEKPKADFTLKTPIETDPEKDTDQTEYKGLMTYTVKYDKKDVRRQP